MALDSSSAGYLSPQTSSLEDVELNRFLRSLVVGITAMPGKTVFQRWQPGGEPPNLPDFGTDWAAVGESGDRQKDTFAYSEQTDNGLLVYRNEILTVLVSFYGPNARRNANVLSMGFMVAQNREAMQQNGYGFVDISSSLLTSDLFNNRWVQRIDVSFRVRRSVTFIYPVLDLVGAQIVFTEPADTVTVIEQQLPMFAWGPEGNFVAGWGSGNWISKE